ncbi:MAG: hypothetical protein IIC57_08480, partial [Proteobacteria bacterium]|nr:hypothetical protein [Pseudomonadota bacterium]
MQSDYTVTPLVPDQIAQAYALIQAVESSVSLKQWRDFVDSVTCPAKKAAPKKKAPKKTVAKNTVAKKTPKKTAATKTAKKKPAMNKPAPKRVVVKIKSGPPPPAEERPPQRTVNAKEKSKGENPITLHHRKPTREEYVDLRKLLIDRRKQLLGDVKDLEAEAFSDESKNVSSNHLADSSFEQYEQEFNLSMIA